MNEPHHSIPIAPTLCIQPARPRINIRIRPRLGIQVCSVRHGSDTAITLGSAETLGVDLEPGRNSLAELVLGTVLGSGSEIGQDGGAERVGKSDPAYDSSLVGNYQVEEPAWGAGEVVLRLRSQHVGRKARPLAQQ